jgi:tetratricopeptide (TPR) repeat protein
LTTGLKKIEQDFAKKIFNLFQSNWADLQCRVLRKTDLSNSMHWHTQSNDLNDLEQSRDYYAEAFEKAQDDYYTGINAAAKSVLLGTPEDLKKADEYAKKVQQITGVDVSPGDYWKTATAAEVFLIQKKYKQAAEIYKEAIVIGRSRSRGDPCEV